MHAHHTTAAPRALRALPAAALPSLQTMASAAEEDELVAKFKLEAFQLQVGVLFGFSGRKEGAPPIARKTLARCAFCISTTHTLPHYLMGRTSHTSQACVICDGTASSQRRRSTARHTLLHLQVLRRLFFYVPHTHTRSHACR